MLSSHLLRQLRVSGSSVSGLVLLSVYLDQGSAAVLPVQCVTTLQQTIHLLRFPCCLQIVKAMKDQADRIALTSRAFYNGELTVLLIAWTFHHLTRCTCRTTHKQLQCSLCYLATCTSVYQTHAT